MKSLGRTEKVFDNTAASFRLSSFNTLQSFLICIFSPLLVRTEWETKIPCFLKCQKWDRLTLLSHLSPSPPPPPSQFFHMRLWQKIDKIFHMWSKWQKHPRQVLIKSTVIPKWHDVAKQGDWFVGSILQWQLRSCEIWIPTRKCTDRLKAMLQQVLKFCLDLMGCYQLHLHIIAALLHIDNGETPQCLGACPCLRVCLWWSLILEKVHGKNHWQLSHSQVGKLP